MRLFLIPALFFFANIVVAYCSLSLAYGHSSGNSIQGWFTTLSLLGLAVCIPLWFIFIKNKTKYNKGEEKTEHPSPSQQQVAAKNQAPPTRLRKIFTFILVTFFAAPMAYIVLISGARNLYKVTRNEVLTYIHEKKILWQIFPQRLP